MHISLYYHHNTTVCNSNIFSSFNHLATDPTSHDTVLTVLTHISYTTTHPSYLQYTNLYTNPIYTTTHYNDISITIPPHTSQHRNTTSIPPRTPHYPSYSSSLPRRLSFTIIPIYIPLTLPHLHTLPQYILYHLHLTHSLHLHSNTYHPLLHPTLTLS